MTITLIALTSVTSFTFILGFTIGMLIAENRRR